MFGSQPDAEYRGTSSVLRSVVLCCLFACSESTVPPSEAPAPGGVVAEVPCPDCQVSISEPLQLGPAELGDLKVTSRIVAADSGGQLRLVYAPTSTPGQIGVYDATTRTTRFVGRRGNGPDELPDIATIALMGPDSIVVVHGRTFSVVDLVTGSLVRHRLPPQVSTLFLAGGSTGIFVVNNDLPIGSRFLTIGVDGGLRSRWGPEDDPNAEVSSQRYHHVALSARGMVVTNPINASWGLTVWSEAGKLVRSIPAPDWFRSMPDRLLRSQDGGVADSLRRVEATPIHGVGTLDGGIILVSARVPALPGSGETDGKDAPFDGRVTAIDGETGETLATIRLPRYVQLPGNGWLLAVYPDSLGFLHATAQKLSVTRVGAVVP